MKALCEYSCNSDFEMIKNQVEGRYFANYT